VSSNNYSNLQTKVVFLLLKHSKGKLSSRTICLKDYVGIKMGSIVANLISDLFMNIENRYRICNGDTPHQKPT